MANLPVANIIINNHNYARFLGAAIDSALGQTYPNTEIIIVDDGSSDESPSVIARYGSRVVPVFKPNGGQESALNAGFAASRGQVLCFLDADDMLSPGALERAVRCFEDPRVVKVHWPLRAADEQGRPLSRLIPAAELAEGDLRHVVASRGPRSYVSSPTSGNAWARRFLDAVFPIRSSTLKCGSADAYLSALAPLFGLVARVPEPQGCYRLHADNGLWGRHLEKLDPVLEDWERDARLLADALASRGIAADVEAWRGQSWYHRLRQALLEIERIVPAGDRFLLADGDEWGLPEALGSRHRIPFPELDGLYWGPPANDEAAIRELERLRREARPGLLIFGWPTFWWLDHYTEFARYLDQRYGRQHASDLVRAFDLRPGGGGP
jgi:hypothetical protein